MEMGSRFLLLLRTIGRHMSMHKGLTRLVGKVVRYPEIRMMAQHSVVTISDTMACSHQAYRNKKVDN
jgi:hypothetical protein